jgi:hypothetical protein
MRFRSLCFSLGLAAACTLPASADRTTFAADDHTLYRITSYTAGPQQSLDVLNNGYENRVQLDGSSGAPTQLWSIHQHHDGTFAIFTGSGSSCRRLDIAFNREGGKITQVLLDSPSHAATQRWNIYRSEFGTYFRLENADISNPQSIQVVNVRGVDVLQMAPNERISAQHFFLTPVGHTYGVPRCE